MDTLQKMKELMDQIMADAQKCYEKGVFSRGRTARLQLSELGKLSKLARAEILEQMKKSKEGE